VEALSLTINERGEKTKQDILEHIRRNGLYFGNRWMIME
jgi:hypothetical protein